MEEGDYPDYWEGNLPFTHKEPKQHISQYEPSQASEFHLPYPIQQSVTPLGDGFSPFGEPQYSFDGDDDSFFQPNFPHLQQHVQLPYSGDPLNRGFLANAPIVHEGFIPAPGREADDEFDEDGDIDDLASSYRDSLFQRQSEDEDEDEDDSEEERAILAEEDRILREIEKKQNDEGYDPDFDANELDNSEEELADEELEEEEDDDELMGNRSNNRGRRGRGRGRGGRGRGGSRAVQEKKRGRPKGVRARPTADPGPQFKEFQRLANDAYLRQDFDTAIKFAHKAIQVNPEIFAAHSLVSEIYADLGDEQKSLEALIIGAPTKRDKELWFYVIERVKKIDPETYPIFTNSNKTAIILDCLTAILQIDSNDWDARSQKLEIESRLGRISKSVKMCRRMLTIRPDESDILKTMARLGTSSPKQSRLHLASIISSFDTSIAYFLANDEPSNSNLDWSLLNIYLDLLDQAGDFERGLSRAKTLSRWLQSRKHETFWDEQKDDREFDAEDDERRVEVPEFKRRSPDAEYGLTLPLEIRVKMGLFRLQLKPPNLEEAMRHFDFLEPEYDGPDPVVLDYPDLFRDVADALHVARFDAEALKFYEPLYKTAFDQMTLRNLIGMYSCYKNVGAEAKCEELLPVFKKWSPDALEDMAVLAKFFEDNGLEEEAMKRGEAVYRYGGGRLLRKVGFRGYEDLQEYFFQEKKRARGKHGLRKSRVRKYMKALRSATGDEGDSDDEGAERNAEDMFSLGFMPDRPRSGFFRTRKSLPGYRPRTFLPDEIPGTNVPTDAIDHTLFQRKLHELATDYPDELKAARAQHREIVASFKHLDLLCPAAEEGDIEAAMEWISIARELIEEFSTFDLFYYDRRKAFNGYFRRIGAHNEIWKDSALMVLAVVANNVEDGEDEPELRERSDKIPEDFYGVHFDKWLNLFAQYAIFLAQYGDEERCFNTIEVASQSNIFYRSQHYFQQLQLCKLACGIALDNSVQASSAIRWFMRTYPFSSDLFRVYGAVNRLCSIPAGFATGPALKVFLRYIKTMDFVLLKPDQREWFNFRGGDHVNWSNTAVLSDSIKFVKDHDPAVFGLYAHVLMCGGSYTAALNYYFRAYTIKPDDPVLNLCIGVAYLQHAMKRLSENRQYQLQQGLSFVYRYHALRTKDNIPAYCSEAYFNLGRIWHSLGLVSQALPAYEKCIEYSEKVQKVAMEKDRWEEIEVDDFATEAAFAMQGIYALSGDFESARRVTEEVLVID